jgi:hypothetical protein
MAKEEKQALTEKLRTSSSGSSYGSVNSSGMDSDESAKPVATSCCAKTKSCLCSRCTLNLGIFGLSVLNLLGTYRNFTGGYSFFADIAKMETLGTGGVVGAYIIASLAVLPSVLILHNSSERLLTKKLPDLYRKIVANPIPEPAVAVAVAPLKPVIFEQNGAGAMPMPYLLEGESDVENLLKTPANPLPGKPLMPNIAEHSSISKWQQCKSILMHHRTLMLTNLLIVSACAIVASTPPAEMTQDSFNQLHGPLIKDESARQGVGDMFYYTSFASQSLTFLVKLIEVQDVFASFAKDLKPADLRQQYGDRWGWYFARNLLAYTVLTGVVVLSLYSYYVNGEDFMRDTWHDSRKPSEISFGLFAASAFGAQNMADTVKTIKAVFKNQYPPHAKTRAVVADIATTLLCLLSAASTVYYTYQAEQETMSIDANAGSKALAYMLLGCIAFCSFTVRFINVREQVQSYLIPKVPLTDATGSSTSMATSNPRSPSPQEARLGVANPNTVTDAAPLPA